MLNLNDLVKQCNNAVSLMQYNMPIVIKIIGLLYIINIVNWLLKYRLNILGIYPRSLFGLLGIICAPLLHGNFSHLFANALPLFILMNFVLLYGPDNFCNVSLTIIVLGGLGTWLCGRKGLHIGASGLAMGYWAYLLMCAYQQDTFIAVVLGVLCLYYLGGMVVNVLPAGIKSSWSGHVFGLAAGLIAAYYNSYLAYWISKCLAHLH